MQRCFLFFPGTPRLFLIGWIACSLLFPLVGCLPRSQSPGFVHSTPAAEFSSIEIADATVESEAVGNRLDPLEWRQQILQDLGVLKWHQQGFKADGVKVAILDTGFHGYRTHLGKSLPARVAVRSFRKDANLEARDSQHGILCGEVVRALAPNVEILLANWEVDRPDSFLEAVRWARSEGARVISCSVIMPTWSDGEGHGAMHQKLADLLRPGPDGRDVLFFASAGNTAQRHWGGEFQAGDHQFHDWGLGLIENVIHPWGTERVSIEMSWRDDSKYELIVEDILDGSSAGQCLLSHHQDLHSAVVRFYPQQGHTYTLRLGKRSGSGGRFHLVVLGGGLDRANSDGSIAFPGDGPEVIAVGAVNRNDQRVVYSSCGSNRAETKPELSAQIPFPSLWRERPFTGTSAAAPQAAGMAALLLGRHPDWSAEKIRQTLEQSTRPLGSACPNPETGYGKIHLPG